ncbi:hypothetical protein HZA85_02830 [Candidatus Uhrbacteria bacterium]|nr:hypothetical protein [Candidatus Uhrbacteria bacterium]
MIARKILFHPSIFAVLFIGVFIANAFVFGSVKLGVVLLIAFVALSGWDMGYLVASQERGPIRWSIGLLAFISILILILTGAFYIGTIPPGLIQVLILLTFPLLNILRHRAAHPSLFERVHDLWNDHRHRLPRSVLATVALIILFGGLLIQHLASSPIIDPVRSPWERLDASIFLLMGLILVLMAALLARGRERALTLPIVSFVLFLFLALVQLVYPIGFGFDGFIHQATESHVAQFGTISPKPLYYVGQYVLVLFLHHGFAIPIKLADGFLVPLLAALLLPSAWYAAAVHITGKRRISMLTLIGLFLLPLSSFIVTTPQGLANLLTLLLILFSVPYLFESERPRLLLCGLVALSTLAVHPIAGLPALLYFALLCVDPSRAPAAWQKPARLIFFGVVVITCVVLPLSFLFNAIVSGQSLGIHPEALNPLRLLSGLNLGLFFENRFNPALDFIYLYGKNALVLLGIVSLAAWWSYRKELSKRTRTLLWMALALAVNYLIMKSVIDFTFLIDYERLNYASRLVPLMAFFLAPFFLLAIAHVMTNLETRPLALRAGMLMLACALILSAWYLTYPRRDAYEINHGFNTSAQDVSTVHFVEDWADSNPYLVLANQSVSAAAISEIGFRYYGSLFFYPIPTGEALYQSFLTMNETPTREVAKQALALVPMHGNIFTLFYIVNDYWWDSARIIETAKTTADDWRAVGDGSVFIFRYDFRRGL